MQFEQLILSTTLGNETKLERLWGEPLGDNLYRLDNIPMINFYYGWNDVVKAVAIPQFPHPVIVQQIERHSYTVMIVAPDVTQHQIKQLRQIANKQRVKFEDSHAPDETFYFAMSLPKNGNEKRRLAKIEQRFKKVCDIQVFFDSALGQAS